ncbi:MAG: histidine kinase dimerization/phospho-acceptor domain-containing protein [Myxococcaceae bacterium]
MDFQLAQVAQIEWTPDTVLCAAEGACEQIFGQDSQALVGQRLHQVLACSEARAAELQMAARAHTPPPAFVSLPRGKARAVLRLALGSKGDKGRAAVMDLSAALAGAPPVQISRLSSSLSHEIRNPLSSVKMAVQTLARNTSLSEKDQRRLVIANREVRTMERMLWLLSEYGRDTPPHLEVTTLKQLLQESVALIDPELAERKILLEIVENAETLKVRIDSARMRPVLAQILLNVAMGLEPGGSVRVEVNGDAQSGARLKLIDPTAALPPEERARLFEPFGSMLARGAGLSLAALYRVMQGQGGTVTAEGSATPGAVYTLSFPP